MTTDQSGNYVSAASQGFVEVSIQSTDGIINDSYSGRLSGLAGVLVGIASANASTGMQTSVELHIGGGSATINFGLSAIGVEDFDANGISQGTTWSYGLGRISGDSNGATSSGWYGPTSIFTEGAAVLSSAGEYGSGAATIGTNLQLYSSGWRGNQFVSTARIAKGLHALGSALTVASAGFDLYAYYGLRNHGGLTQGTLSVNLTMDVVGFMGPSGAGLAAMYYGLQTFYPGGAAGALTDYGNNIQQNQAIDPDYLPMDPGKISFHPKRAPDVVPDYKKSKKRDEVINPDFPPMDPGKI